MTDALNSSFRALLLSLVLINCASGQNEKKTVYGVLLDNTGSMTSQFPQVLSLGKGIVKRLHQRGPISIFSFQMQQRFAVVHSGSEWTQDEAILNNHIDGLSVVTGQTALFDAIETMAQELNAKVNSNNAEFGAKVIFLVTDGNNGNLSANGMIVRSQDEDDLRRKARDRLIKKLKEMEITIYAIGLTRELDDGFIRKPREEAETFLTKLAKQHGGRAVFFKSKKLDADGLLTELLGK
jgi:von Willebrand factor type A domain